MPDLILISLPTSPYAARIWMQCYEKGRDLSNQSPPDGMGSEAHRRLSPFGKAPVLLINETALVESSAIQEYLEDLWPEVSLRPKDALSAAQMRAFIKAVDLYLFPILFKLRSLNDSDGEQKQTLYNELDRVMDQLAEIMPGSDYVVGNQISLADCSLVPIYFYMGLFLKRQNDPSPFDTKPRFVKWRDQILAHKSAQRTLEGLMVAISR